LGVHLCLLALGVTVSRVIHDAGETLKHLSEIGQAQVEKEKRTRLSSVESRC
jgi:hypothetical protein